MSDQSQGPGWWQASDGKWYPPEQAPPTAQQPSVAPTTQQPAYGPPGSVPAAAGAPMAGPPVAAAAAGGGPGKIIAIVVVLALVAGGAAFLLTRGGGDSRSVSSFCTKAKSAKDNIKFEDVLNPAKVDALVSAFDQIAKSAPDEIKADMDALNDALKRERNNVKAGKSPDDGFSSADNSRLDQAGSHIEKFVKEKCGFDLSSSSTEDSSTGFTFDSSSFSRSLSSDFSSFNTDSFSSDLESLCSQFGSDFGSDFCSSS